MYQKVIRPGAIILACVLTLGLSSCTPALREAANNDAPLGLFAKGVRVCVTNATPKYPIRVQWLSVDTHESPTDLATIKPGQTSCGEGTRNLSFDVMMEIKWRVGGSQRMYFGNGWLGYPEASIDENLKTAAEACGFSGIKGPNGVTLGFAYNCTDAYSVNEMRYYPSGSRAAFGPEEHLSEVTRVEDTNWKEFQVVVSQ